MFIEMITEEQLFRGPEPILAATHPQIIAPGQTDTVIARFWAVTKAQSLTVPLSRSPPPISQHPGSLCLYLRCESYRSGVAMGDGERRTSKKSRILLLKTFLDLIQSA